MAWWGLCVLPVKPPCIAAPGLVSVLSHAQHNIAVTAACPPLMVHDAACSETTKRLINHCDIVVIGPGLGTDAWATRVDGRGILDSDKPLIVDADALHLLAEDPTHIGTLDPHPTSGRGSTFIDIRQRARYSKNRFAAAQDIRARYGGVCVLKGAGTVVASNEQTVVCEGGNPGMSSAGMGDVLSGVIASLQGQGLARVKAALLGTCVHARAGDLAAAKLTAWS